MTNFGGIMCDLPVFHCWELNGYVKPHVKQIQPHVYYFEKETSLQ
jgi:hypothetical protein